MSKKFHNLSYATIVCCWHYGASLGGQASCRHVAFPERVRAHLLAGGVPQLVGLMDWTKLKLGLSSRMVPFLRSSADTSECALRTLFK